MDASPMPVLVTGPHSSEGRTPYGEALHQVVRQQEKVSKQLAEQDWKDLVEETSDWASYIRRLSSYSEVTSDPVRFRKCCDGLLEQTKNLRNAALRGDAVRCDAAIRATDPLLNMLSRDFASPAPPTASPPPRRPAAVP